MAAYKDLPSNIRLSVFHMNIFFLLHLLMLTSMCLTFAQVWETETSFLIRLMRRHRFAHESTVRLQFERVSRISSWKYVKTTLFSQLETKYRFGLIQNLLLLLLAFTLNTKKVFNAKNTFLSGDGWQHCWFNHLIYLSITIFRGNIRSGEKLMQFEAFTKKERICRFQIAWKWQSDANSMATLQIFKVESAMNS